MKTTPVSPSNHIEPLESRIAPAGVVTAVYVAATGELTLSDNGGGLDNVVNVFQTGVNTYRVEGISTDINTVGTTFLDIGKLTRLTIAGGVGEDTFQLFNLRTLASLTFSGGDGNDTFNATNLAVTGAVDVRGNTGGDSATFLGASTSIGGDLTAESDTGAADLISVNFVAQKTVIGGRILFTGGGGLDLLQSFADGPVTIKKGVSFDSGLGGGRIEFGNEDLLSIGKLATGESILFTGGAAPDALVFNGVNVTLAGGIRMTGGGMDDPISFLNTSGVVKVGKLATGQSILFDGGAGADSISTNASSLTFAGGIDFLGADGSNSILMEGASGTISVGKLPGGASIRYTGGSDGNSIATLSAQLTLAGGIDFAATGGTSSINLEGPGGKATLGKLATGQSIRWIGGNGNDFIDMSVNTLALAGGIEFAAGDGVNSLKLDVESGSTAIGKFGARHSIKYTGSTGTDDISLVSNRLSLSGGLQFDSGDGTNTINLESGSVKIGALTTGQSILMNGGTGSDDLSTDLARATLTGGIEHNGGGGDNDLEFDDDGIIKIGKFGTGQSVKFTGIADADNEIDFGGFTTLAGSVEVTGGSGSDDIDFDGKVSVGKNAAGVSVQMIGNDGDDDLDFQNNTTLAGSVKHDGGNGDDEIDFNSVDSLTIKGSVAFLGGANNDKFDINSFALLIGGSMTFDGSDGADSVSVAADGSIGGDVNITMGLANANETLVFTAHTNLVFGLALKGKLTIDTGALTTPDSLRITNVSIAKAIDIKLGNAASTVNIDNLKAGDTFSLDTRDGADVVNFERGNFFGNSVIKKLATIQLGLGDDQLSIGSPTPTVIAPFPDSTRVNFQGGLTTDGGAGANDNRNLFENENTFGVAITPPIGFELTSLP